MEKEQAINYLSIITKNIKKYIYLENEIKGQDKAKKKSAFGVISPTTLLDVKNVLNPKFQIINEKIENSRYKIIYKKKSD